MDIRSDGQIHRLKQGENINNAPKGADLGGKQLVTENCHGKSS
jgi:hypothetical protein